MAAGKKREAIIRPLAELMTVPAADFCLSPANTIRSRINKLPLKEKILRRQGAKSLRKLNPVSASFPEAIYLLQVLQIDHTPVDLIIVDEVTRQAIGRPYLTVAIDIYSRCITGFCLTLEAPGAVSVGLCLAHSILDKESWMTERKIDGK